MGASRQVGARLVGFMQAVQSSGAAAALRALNLERLAGLPISQVFEGLIDYICPPGGSVDEGIAREAYVETTIELVQMEGVSLDALTPDQMQTVFELFATHAIEARIYNDIGAKLISCPATAQAAVSIQQMLRDFIRNGVSDAMTQARAANPNLQQDQILGFVDGVYESAFTILKDMGDQEASQ